MGSALAEFDRGNGAAGQPVAASYRTQVLPHGSAAVFGLGMLTTRRSDKYLFPVRLGFVFAIFSALRDLEAGLQQRARLSFRGRLKLTPYDSKPQRLLRQISYTIQPPPAAGTYCAGFEMAVWRCDALANHLVEWMADYALKEDELRIHHGNMYVRLREAAARIYTSGAYATRGEIGEIVLHAICRDFFGTIPIAPRVFYLTSSNDVVKSFDLVHVRYSDGAPELWLGEAKFYTDGIEGMRAAVKSLNDHLELGFLKHEKLILGPQVSTSVPEYQKIREMLSEQTSLDELFRTAVFPIGIVCDSAAIANATTICGEYTTQLGGELVKLSQILLASGLPQKVRLLLVYLPLGSKQKLADAFDARLRGLAQ